LNKKRAAPANIRFHYVDEYLSREQKLSNIVELQSIGGISKRCGWTAVTPNEHGDWIRQRDKTFDALFPLGDKDKHGAPALFANFSLGVVTNRDSWCVNASTVSLLANIRILAGTYEAERERLRALGKSFANVGERETFINDFVLVDPRRISWTRSLKQSLATGAPIVVESAKATLCAYRPFTRQWIYFDRRLNEMVYQMPRIFPEAGMTNRVIGLTSGTNRGELFDNNGRRTA
jgi:predicted helicase